MLKQKVVPIATTHADPQHDKVAEQKHDKTPAPIIREITAESLAAETCLGDLHCIEWLPDELPD